MWGLIFLLGFLTVGGIGMYAVQSALEGEREAGRQACRAEISAENLARVHESLKNHMELTRNAKEQVQEAEEKAALAHAELKEHREQREEGCACSVELPN